MTPEMEAKKREWRQKVYPPEQFAAMYPDERVNVPVGDTGFVTAAGSGVTESDISDALYGSESVTYAEGE